MPRAAHPWRSAPIAIAGLGLGDEGKGATVDALVRALGRRVVVRHNGGPQAAHHVVRGDGAVHCFAQFGAGTLVPGVRTCLARAMLVEPLGLAREAAALARLGVQDPLTRVTVDAACAVVTPFHRLFGRIQELARGTGRHGSCGLGVGAAYVDARNPALPTLRFAELHDQGALRRKLRLIQLIKLDQAEQLADAAASPALAALLAELARPGVVDDLLPAYAAVAAAVTTDDGAGLRSVLRDSPGSVVFEGAQGVLLDADRGFWPHVSPGAPGFDHADELLRDAGAPPPLRLGVLRAYATRHGPGPLVSEDPALAARLPEPHNPDGAWQGPMRVGWFDLVATRHALAIAGGVDGLALTCLDRLAGTGPLAVCVAYRDEQAATLAVLPPPPPDRAAQAALTARLQRCTPVLQPRPGWSAAGLSDPARAYARELADLLAVPLAGLAAGPTAADREWSPPLPAA
jgi:adenylosuccinate synthase